MNDTIIEITNGLAPGDGVVVQDTPDKSTVRRRGVRKAKRKLSELEVSEGRGKGR